MSFSGLSSVTNDIDRPSACLQVQTLLTQMVSKFQLVPDSFEIHGRQFGISLFALL